MLSEYRTSLPLKSRRAFYDEYKHAHVAHSWNSKVQASSSMKSFYILNRVCGTFKMRNLSVLFKIHSDSFLIKLIRDNSNEITN